uniref:SAM domain-containing protein n=1 Tax=Noctiluca scintillans TaxID=2966 RepID=A0A7S1B0N5_NOCSC|mmetsp:Transcript_7760/g.21235  ORF Transcript_7760/g.21235 Transcript_7760/m.21235 type:complete len:495 (+) Transcript_7760:65-1549(+)
MVTLSSLDAGMRHQSWECQRHQDEEGGTARLPCAEKGAACLEVDELHACFAASPVSSRVRQSRHLGSEDSFALSSTVPSVLTPRCSRESQFVQDASDTSSSAKESVRRPVVFPVTPPQRGPSLMELASDSISPWRTLAESCESTEPGDHEDLDGESSCDSSSACGADLGSQFKHDTVPRIQSPSPSRACEAAPRHPPPLRWRSMTCDQDPVGGWTPRNPRVPALETPTVQSGAKCVESPHSGSSTQGYPSTGSTSQWSDSDPSGDGYEVCAEASFDNGAATRTPLQRWSVEEVCSWCASRSLPPEITDILRCEEVNGFVLSTITEQDLRELRVDKFGWRRQLMLEVKNIVENAPRCETLADHAVSTSCGSGSWHDGECHPPSSCAVAFGNSVVGSPSCSTPRFPLENHNVACPLMSRKNVSPPACPSFDGSSRSGQLSARPAHLTPSLPPRDAFGVSAWGPKPMFYSPTMPHSVRAGTSAPASSNRRVVCPRLA